MKPKNQYPQCTTCKHWKNQQAELDYADFDGVCTSDKLKFNTTDGRSAQILDRNNLSSGAFKNTQEFESLGQYFKPVKSRYFWA